MDIRQCNPEHNENLANKHTSLSPSTIQSLPHSEKLSTKTAQILRACREEDLDALRALAVYDGGLVSDEVRQHAWPLLLGDTTHDDNIKGGTSGDTSWRKLPPHGDEDQVRLDVDRSFIYYPHDQSRKEIERRKAELSDLITEVLRRLPYLSYFQGYHDICQVFLLVLKPRQRASAVARLSALRIRDFMLPTFSQALAQLQLIPSIIYAVNPQLWRHLSLTQPFFALSGTLTMYAHDIQEYGEIARIFDVLLAREAVFSLYMFAQIVLQRSGELFETPADEPEILHSILSKLPTPLDMDALIRHTVDLLESYPPERLKGWRSISGSSVLKTARWPHQIASQTLEHGHAYFRHQAREQRLVEQREHVMKLICKYHRPVRAVGITVFVALIAICLRRSSSPGYFWALWRHWTGHLAV